MKEGRMFYMSTAPLCDGKFVKAVDSNGCIHIYDIKNKEWSIM